MSAAGIAGRGLHGRAPGAGRFRTAVCAYSFRKGLQDKSFAYADLIRFTADLGADGIDLTTYWLPDTSDQTLFGLKRLAYRSGVALYSIGIRAHMAQPTQELQAAEVATVRKWLDVAERLGASHMRIFGGALPKGATEDQAVAWAVETLKRAAEEAGKQGITLGVEDDGGITTNADRTVEIVKKADSPWAGINLDIGNFPDDGYRQIEMCAPYATDVHFKSEVHVAKKAEPTDVGRVLDILAKAAYRGYLAMEYEAEGDPRIEVPRLISQMRQAMGR